MSDTIQITRAAACEAHSKADPKTKHILELLLGKENMQPLDITERVKTYEDACDVLGIDPDGELPVFSSITLDGNPGATEAFVKLRIIAKALNEGWTPDWRDASEYKYYPWFNNDGSGFRFYDYDVSCRNSAVGSRLCYKSSKLATYAGKQFADLYNQMFS